MVEEQAPPSEAIHLDRVTKHYGDVLAVDGLDLSIQQGEFLTLLGPSGCGKTTTLRVIGGFEIPDGGEVFIDGEPMQKRPPFKRPVNTVFQHYALFPHMTVGENIGYGLKMGGARRDEVKQTVGKMLELVQLKGVEGRKPRELSGGQQQRVALARALAMQPKVLLLDEPLGSLDYKLRKEMQIELKEIHRTIGTTFVYVTHDQEEALAMSDRICVMSRGVVMQAGTPGSIYDAPESYFVARFVGDMNFLPGTISSIGGGAVLATVEGMGTVVSERPREDLGVGKSVMVGVRPEDLRIVAEGEDGTNIFEGRCIDRLTIGRNTTAVVDFGPGRVKAEIPRHVGGDLRGPIRLAWPAARVFMFPREEAVA